MRARARVNACTHVVSLRRKLKCHEEVMEGLGEEEGRETTVADGPPEMLRRELSRR